MSMAGGGVRNPGLLFGSTDTRATTRSRIMCISAASLHDHPGRGDFRLTDVRGNVVHDIFA